MRPRQPHYVVVVNSNAGSSSKFSEEALKAASPDATFDILSVAPEGLTAAFDKAFSAKPTAVIVVGGDGTARTAAVRAVQTGVPIIPMPGGTMNVLPKIVFGHGDMARAIADLPRLKPSALDVGRVSGEMFFLSAAFGLAGPMARLREATRSEHKFDRVRKAAWRAAEKHPPVARMPRALAHAEQKSGATPTRSSWRSATSNASSRPTAKIMARASKWPR